jgi:predicted nucleic acid-binding protein
MNSMPAGKVFLDANILVYAQDRDSPAKRRRSREVIASLAQSGNGVISTQVLQEFYVAVTRKMGVAPLAAKRVMQTFKIFEIVQASPDLIESAIDCSVLNGISFWDALIVAAAAASACVIVYSEDLNSGQTIQGVRIENPFG